MPVNPSSNVTKTPRIGGISLPGECPFCNYHPRNEIIWESENFFLVPSVGQITEGYLLLCTKKHYLGMADIPSEQFIELEAALLKIQTLAAGIYGPSIVWEHGSAGCAKAVGGCLNHAHFNIFPINARKIIEKVSPEFKLKPIKNIPEIKNITGSYIFLKDSDEACYILTTDGVTPSQYFRQLVARELGREEKWDWRNYVGESEFLETIKKLRPLLKDFN